jgi:hypothetical protein
MPCAAASIPTPFPFSEGHRVVRVTYEPHHLAVHVQGAQGHPAFIVAFEGVTAFRVTDEGNLLNFWPTCSRANGWLFEVREGGWLSEQVGSAGNLIDAMNPRLREFLVTGDDDCVSVLSLTSPTVTLSPGWCT